MGFEYRGVPRTGDAIPWDTVRGVLAACDDIAVLSEDGAEIAFAFRAIARDRSTWAEDGCVRAEPGGSLYVVIHVGPHQSFIARLAQLLAQTGAGVDFDEL